MINLKKFDVFWADLSPRFGTEPGKVRPVVVVQTDLINDIHPSVIICPLTSKVQPDAEILRVHVDNLGNKSDIMVDQIRAVDRKRLIEKIGTIDRSTQRRLIESLRILVLE